MVRTQELFTIVHCTIGRETDNAILIAMDDRDDFWLPLSQVEKIERHPEGWARVICTVWIAKQKNLI